MIKINLVNGTKEKKVLIDLLPQFDANVQQFLQRIIYLCGIRKAEAEDLQLYHQDYLLPYRLPSVCISPEKHYTVVFKRDLYCKSFDSSGVRKDKKQQKIKKGKRKQKQLSSSESQQSSFSLKLSESRSSSSLEDYSAVNRKKQADKIKCDKPIKQNKKKEPPAQVQKKPQKVQKIKPAQLIKSVPTTRPKAERKASSSSSSEVIPIKKAKVQQKPQSSQQSESSEEIVKQKFVKISQPPKISIQPPKKPIQQHESEDSSLEEAQQHKIHKQKVSQILQTINSKTKQKQKQKQKQKIVKPVILQKPANIPIAVRNKKTEKKPVVAQSKNDEESTKPKQQSQPKQPVSFKQYKEMKWVSVTKQILNIWKQKGQHCILAENNEIRFKVMELDEEKFIPVNSGWICGFISQVSVNGKDINIKLQNATKEGRNVGQNTQFFNQYEIPFHNMQELQINKNTLIDLQKQTLITKSSQASQKTQEVQREAAPQVPSKPAESKGENLEAQKPAQSLQQFICGQIHYYFGQKNYQTDLFMQMHANRDEKKYIDFKLMLNFPKIKKVLKDEQKLWSYLIDDEKYSSRNYELDFERKMIRKKGLS